MTRWDLITLIAFNRNKKIDLQSATFSGFLSYLNQGVKSISAQRLPAFHCFLSNEKKMSTDFMNSSG